MSIQDFINHARQRRKHGSKAVQRRPGFKERSVARHRAHVAERAALDKIAGDVVKKAAKKAAEKSKTGDAASAAKTES